MNAPRETPQRLVDLLADQALFGLSPKDEIELRKLLRDHSQIDSEEIERIVAEIEATTLRAPTEGLPADMRARILNANETKATNEPSRGERENGLPTGQMRQFTAPRSGVGKWSGMGWIVAVAASVLAILGWSGRDRGGNLNTSIDPNTARTALLASAKDLSQGKWEAQADPAAAGALGDVVWSDSAQSGFMRFMGLAANDPSSEQYQLWIFDPAQDAATPVDGGVFDIPAGQTEVVVPIRAKLHVERPTMFAVTVEKPGGVVVSKRTRLPLLAKVTQVSR